jgi:hypothetical protein
MKTGDMFICKVCGLPIRNPVEAADDDSEHFICKTCEVCDSVSESQMQSLQDGLLDQLSWIIENLYRRTHAGLSPPPGFMSAVRERLGKQSNPADEALKSITPILEPGCLYEDLLRQVAESERTLAGFYYLSGNRYTHINSKTVLRHWVATVNRMERLVKKYPRNYDVVLKSILKGRYELGLARLARLIGDNPVTIDRNPSNYRGKRRKHLLDPRHVEALMKQTANAKLNPQITKRDLKEILRFAGNASFITEHDEVIEFREKETRHLCKYLLKDQILIVINDLGFLAGNAAKASDTIPLAELVTIYPKELAAKQLTNDLAKGRYLPNCVYLPELLNLSKEVDAGSAATATT